VAIIGTPPHYSFLRLNRNVKPPLLVAVFGTSPWYLYQYVMGFLIGL